MDDIVKPIGKWISENVPFAVLIGLFIFCLFFEVSKVQVYPLRWLWRTISWPFKKIDEQRTQSFKNIVNGMKTDLDTKLEEMKNGTNQNCIVAQENFVKLEGRFNDLDLRFDELDKKQAETEERLDQLAAARIKNHVFNFARQCRNGEKHSVADFKNLTEEHKEYERLVKRHGWSNDVYSHDYAYIMKVYDKGNEEGTFLE